MMRDDSLEEIFRLYMNDIYRYLYSFCRDHHLAEELVQETFYRAYLSLETDVDERIKPWLLRVARNALIDHERKRKRTKPKDVSFFEEKLVSQGPEQSLFVRERVDDVKQALLTLPDKQRQAVVLRDFRQLSYQEGAEAMGVTLAEFKVLLFRGRQTIRQRLERVDANERGV
jgi:RNA polymerase sigma-70 factor, ECF subfamily